MQLKDLASHLKTIKPADADKTGGGGAIEEIQETYLNNIGGAKTGVIANLYDAWLNASWSKAF